LALWRRVQAEFAIRDSGGCELLMQACSAVDTAESLAEEIARDGPVIRDPDRGLKSHPGIRDQLTARSLCLRALEKLGITLELVNKGIGRPPKRGGW
jgi:hypothetical protein